MMSWGSVARLAQKQNEAGSAATSGNADELGMEEDEGESEVQELGEDENNQLDSSDAKAQEPAPAEAGGEPAPARDEGAEPAGGDEASQEERPAAGDEEQEGGGEGQDEAAAEEDEEEEDEGSVHLDAPLTLEAEAPPDAGFAAHAIKPDSDEEDE